MHLKIQRVATLIEKFGLLKGLHLYIGLRKNILSKIQLPDIKNPVYIRAGTTDSAIFNQVFVLEEYAFPVSFKPEIIVDAGAHIGLFTIFLKNKYPSAKFICVEPGKGNYLQLRQNLQKYDGIETINAAILDRTVQVVMQEHDNFGQSGLQALENENGDVAAMTMDNLINEFGLSHIDILKMDVETAEKVIFMKDQCGWLKCVRLIVIELHDWLEAGCAKIFFEAVNHHFEDYRYSVCGENTIIENLGFGK